MVNKLLTVIFFFIFINLETYCYILSGRVSGEELRGVPDALISINGNQYTALTDIQGNFLFDNLIPGQYLIEITKERYIPFKDTIIIADSDLKIYPHIEPIRVFTDSTRNLQSYHNYFSSLGQGQILFIHLDSLKRGRKGLQLYASFFNNTDSVLYVIRDLTCLRTINPIIYNSAGGVLKQNRAYIDCLGEKTHPFNYDLIEIKPHRKVNFPIIILELYGFEGYPEGTYSIRIRYSTSRYLERIEYLPEESRPVIELSLRGEYYSANGLEYNNSPSR